MRSKRGFKIGVDEEKGLPNGPANEAGAGQERKKAWVCEKNGRQALKKWVKIWISARQQSQASRKDYPVSKTSVGERSLKGPGERE